MEWWYGNDEDEALRQELAFGYKPKPDGQCEKCGRPGLVGVDLDLYDYGRILKCVVALDGGREC